MFRFCRVLITLVVVTSIGSTLATAVAEETTFNVPLRANYEFNILGGTPLNPGDDTGYIPFAALGEFTIQLDASLNDPNASSVPFTNVTGQLQGTPPSPPNLLPHFISPNVMFVGGDLTSIVRDKNGEVLSGYVDNLEMQWEFVGLPGSDLAGVQLITGGSALDPKSHLPFFGEIHGIPFPIGDVIMGPDVVDPTLGDEAFEVFLPGFPTPVVLGRNRTLTVVPEPTSFLAIGIGAMVILVLQRRR